MSQSVKRGARILGSIAAEPKPVAALAEEFGIHRSTMFRELQALEEVGFARRLADGRFVPGLRLAALGSAALENLDLHDAAFEHVRRLHRLVGNTVHVGTRWPRPVTTPNVHVAAIHVHATGCSLRRIVEASSPFLDPAWTATGPAWKPLPIPAGGVGSGARRATPPFLNRSPAWGAPIAGALSCTVMTLRRAVASVSAVVDDMRVSEVAADGSGTHQVTQDQPTTGLPTPTTPFVGRVDELEQVESLLADRRVRLVTLLGPGGTGKTRLALEAAGRARASFSDGVYFVPLISVSTVAGITERVAEVLALREESLAAPGTQRVLLVLDNFEHLSAHAGWVAAALDACPRIVIVTTSREALNLSNEWVLPVDGLSFPAEAVGAADADRYDAVMLFDVRARQVQRNFDLRAEFSHVARICRLVEGLPLALELAAAWLRTLSPREIAAEIQHSLNILQTKHRDVAVRHRSVGAVFEQSWRLLTDSDQKAFKRLVIFPGGFSRDAAGSVARIDLASLDTLIDKSLVRRRGEDRYEIHELLRQFGEARLEENSEEHRAVLTQCSAYYATFLDRQTKNFGGMRSAVRLSQLGQEIGNIQRALSYLLSQQRVAEIGGSLTALCYLYQQAGWLVEGEQDFAHIVDRLREGAPSRERTLALSRALTGLAWWRHCRDQHEPAIQLLDESLTLLAGAQSPGVDQGLVRLYRGRARRALGDHAGSRRDFARAEADFTAEAWSYGLWLTEIYTAELDADEGLHDRAAAACTRALATAERSELITAQIEALAHLGVVEIRLGEINRARLHLLRAARLCGNHQVVHPAAALLVAAALLLQQCGHTGSAASLAHRAATRPDADFSVRRTARELLKTSRAVPDEAMPGTDGSPRARYILELDGHDNLAQLCELLDGLDVDALARPVLTHRERQVLELLARGASNLQIAHRLGVAEGTVKGYTHHLFAKLGVQNRAEAVYESTQRNLL